MTYFNNYLGEKSGYYKEIAHRNRREAYFEMADEVKMMAKNSAEDGKITIEKLNEIIEDRLECYLDVYGEDEKDGEE